MTTSNATKPVIGLANPAVPIAQGAITHTTRVPNSNTEYAPIRCFKKLAVDELVGVDSADPRNRTVLTLGGVVGTFPKASYIAPEKAVPTTVLARGDSDPLAGDEASEDRAIEPTLITKVHAGQTSMHVDIDPATRQAIQSLTDVVPQDILAASAQIYFSAADDEVLLTPVHPVFREYEMRRLRMERRKAEKKMPRTGVLPAGGKNSQNCGVFNTLNLGARYFCFPGFSADADFSLRVFLARLAKGRSSGASFVHGLLQDAPLPARTIKQLRHLASEPDTRANHGRIDRAAELLSAHLCQVLPAPIATLRWALEKNPGLEGHDLIRSLPVPLREMIMSGPRSDAHRAALETAALDLVVARIERAGLPQDAEDIPALPAAVRARLSNVIRIPLEA